MVYYQTPLFLDTFCSNSLDYLLMPLWYNCFSLYRNLFISQPLSCSSLLLSLSGHKMGTSTPLIVNLDLAPWIQDLCNQQFYPFQKPLFYSLKALNSKQGYQKKASSRYEVSHIFGLLRTRIVAKLDNFRETKQPCVAQWVWTTLE